MKACIHKNRLIQECCFIKPQSRNNPNTQQKVKDKPVVAYLYNPILFSNKKKQNIDIHKDTNEPQKHPAEQKQADTKDYTLWFHLYKIPG